MAGNAPLTINTDKPSPSGDEYNRLQDEMQHRFDEIQQQLDSAESAIDVTLAHVRKLAFLGG